MQTRGGHLGTRQACSLILLTATLVGSCVALAMRTLMESGSGMLMVLLIVGAFMSIMSVTVTLTRRHIRQRREAGYRTACFQCIQLAPLEPSAPVRPASRSSAHVAPSHCEQLELSVRSALSALPEHVVSNDREEDCALCMEPMLKDERVRQLPSCGHTYHTKCIDRWLCDGQAHQRRRCPLCNADPVETVAVTCPPGVRPGEALRVTHLGGEYDVVVPRGIQPGQSFHTNLPRRPMEAEAASPVPVAVAVEISQATVA